MWVDTLFAINYHLLYTVYIWPYFGVGPRSTKAYEEEAAQGPSDGSADERQDIVDGAKFPRQEADADGDQAGDTGCNKARRDAIIVNVDTH